MSIDLGRKSEYGGPATLSEPMKDDRTYYPEFVYSGEQELDLPDEGTMTIKFRKTREVEEKRGDKDWYQCNIEVCSIEEVKGEEDDEVEAPSKIDRSTEDALDRLAKALKIHETNDKDKDDY